MKRKILIMLVAAVGLQTAKAQDGERAVMKGQNSVNVYYGLNLMRGFYKGVANSSGSDVQIGGLGPVGIVFEHMVTDGIGIGAEVGYGTTTVGWNYESIDWSGSSNTLQTYHTEYRFTTIRAQFRANFHFIKSSNFDMYFLLSAGYRHQTFSVTSTEPGYSGGTIGGFIPFGLKPGLGFRYFFNGPIGLHAELALGTPMACGGLSFRF